MRGPLKITSITYVPSISDVEVVKPLVARLRGRDVAETLNNVLEWEERNISYWKERGYFNRLYVLTTAGYIWIAIIMAVLFASPLALTLCSILILAMPPYITLIVSILFAVLVACKLIIVPMLKGMFRFTVVLLSGLPLWLYVAVLAEVLPHIYNLYPPIKFVLLISRPIAWLMVGVLSFALTYFSTIYPVFYAGGGKKRRRARILELMDLTFKQSIPLRKVLEYRLAICKDYAKLTASILVNLYPDHKIYFLEIPKHVATAIEIDGKIYVLDQRLPIMSLEAWLMRWSVEKAKKLLLVKNGRLGVEYVGEVVARKSSLGFNLGEDLEKLISAVCKTVESGEKTLRYTLSSYGEVLDVDDPVIGESLRRWIMLALEKELVAYRHLIREVKLSKQGEDIVVSVDLNLNYRKTGS